MRINPKPVTLTLWATFFLLISILTSSLQESAVPPPEDTRLQNAYIALQAWKKAMTSDPNNFTANWKGYDVCSYKGVYCAPAPNNPNIKTVAGIDLNHANIAGLLTEDLGLLLPDLALLHLNSNRFTSTIPTTFSHLKLLHELDISNNLFCGLFPPVLLSLPSLKFLDIRYNRFEGTIPPAVFDLKLDALFVNNNNFSSSLPKNLAKSPVSVLVLANNNLSGCFPQEISKMGGTLHEIILMNVGLKGCLPTSIGELTQATVFDVSFNDLTGSLPQSLEGMKRVEQLNVAHNKFIGEIPSSVCSLPNLQNFTYSYNYFSMEPPTCFKLKAKDNKFNCIPERPLQRSILECGVVLFHPPHCASFGFGCPENPPPPLPSLPPLSHSLLPPPEYIPSEPLIDIPPVIHIP